MSKWSEFVYSFSTTTRPVIEQLVDDSSLGIADLDALKALTTAQLVAKFEAATLADPSFIKAFAASFYNGHSDVGTSDDFLQLQPGEADLKWAEFKLVSDQTWAEIIDGFREDIKSSLLPDYTVYTAQFDPELHPLISQIQTDPEINYLSFSAFESETLAALQAKISGLTTSSSFITELGLYIQTKTPGAIDWTQFVTSSLPGDVNFTALLQLLEQDMTTAGVTYATFAAYDAGELRGAIVNNAANFLNHLAQYLHFWKENDWNRFKAASQGTLETMIGAFTISSESFVALADMVLSQACNMEITLDGDYSIRGIIVDLAGKPLAGKKVKVFDKNYKEMTQLGTTFTSNLDGEYGIAFDKVDLGDPDKESPDLEVEVFESDGTTSIRKGPCVVSAGEETVLNLAVGTGTYTGMVEYEIMHRKLSRVIGDGDITSDTPCDITNLANRFGFGVEQTSQYFQARVFSQMAPNVSSEVFYGLMREGISSNLGVMMLQPSATLVAALLRAANKNVVARWYTEEAPSGTVSSLFTWAHSLIAILKLYFSILALDGGFGNLDVLQAHFDNVAHLSTSLNTTQKTEVVQIYGDTDDRLQDGDLYWSNLESDSSLTTAQIDALKLSITITSALDDNFAFCVDLIQTDSVASIDTVLGYDTSDWEGKITTHSIAAPDAYADTDEYIVSIQNYLETAFATGYLVARLDEQSVVPKSDLLIFFTDNPDFDLDEDHLSEYLVNNTGAFNGASDQIQVKLDLAQLIRLYRVCPNFNKMDVIEALWDEGIKSASQILLLGEGSFKKRMEGVLSEAQTEIVFTKASKRASKALHIYANESNKYTNVLPSVIPQGIIDSENVPDGFDDLADEFATGDFCACKHCQSVFGPAAYLHDLLVWMNGIKDSGDTGGTKTVLDALLVKRAELDSILLNCDNANTEIPYLDLVIELLEHLVVKEQVSPNWSPYSDENSFLSRQSTFSSEELKAFPEHLIASVYTSVLPKTAYPWKTGAFDLWHTQWEKFLSYFNITPYELAEKITDPDGAFASTDEKTARLLGINALESALIRYDASDYNELTSDTLGLHVIYGYTSAANMVSDMFDIASPAPVNVDVLLQRSGLELDELGEYLSSRFVNPNKKQVIFATDSCSLADGNATVDLQEAGLQNLYQFYRLHQKFGGTIQQLDYALGSVSSISQSALNDLAGMKLISAKTNATVDELSVWYNGFSAHTYSSSVSQYESLYLNELTISDFDTIEPLFELDGSGALVSAADYDNATVAAHIQNLLAIDANEYSILKLITGTSRTIDTMAEMHQLVGISRALRVSIAELDTLITLLSFSTSTILDFIERVQQLKSSPFSIAETDYLLTGTTSPNQPVNVAESEITNMLSSLRSDLQKEFGSIVSTDADDHKSEVLSCIEHFANTGISNWSETSHVDDFVSRLERTIDFNIDGSEDATAYNNFVIDVASLNFDEAIDLDPLEPLLFDSGDPSYISPSNMNDRFAVVAELFRAVLLKKPSLYDDAEGIAVNRMAQWLSIDEGLAKEILSTGSNTVESLLDYHNFIDKSDDIAVEAAYNSLIVEVEGLYKVAKVISTLKLDSRHLQGLFTSSWVFSFTKVTDINGHAIADFDQFMDLIDLAAINGKYGPEKDLFDVVIISDIAQKQEELGALTGWPQIIVETIGDGLIDMKKILRMADANQFIQKGALSYEQVVSWNTPVVDRDFTTTPLTVHDGISQSLTLMVKEKASKQGGLGDVAKIRDEIRVKQRDALMNYLIAFKADSGSTVFEDSFDLYDHLLADPEMGACMPSSRIKFASLSAQLFIQRILLGVEISPEGSGGTEVLTLDKENLEEWEWRENYRVWEANRKVFTYPENWMDPDLRDDKTTLFSTMEDALSQVEATNDSVSDIFIDYVESLNEIARLEIAQVFYERAENILHVFARSHGTKRKYYHRKYIDNAFWTEWKEVEIEIETDHLIPIIWNERLMLLWPSFDEKAEAPTKVKQGDLPKKKRAITLNWSILKGEKWTAPNKSTSHVFVADYMMSEGIFFKARKEDSILRVSSFVRVSYWSASSSSELLENIVLEDFVFRNGIDTDPLVEEHTLSASSLKKNQRFSQYGYVKNQKFHSKGGHWPILNSFSFSYARTNNQDDTIGVGVLENVDGNTGFKLTIPHQYVGPYSLSMPKTNRIPLFFEDSEHTFFINQTVKPMNSATASANGLGDALVSSMQLDSSLDFGNVTVGIPVAVSGPLGPVNGMEVSVDGDTQMIASTDGVSYSTENGSTGNRTASAPNQGGNGGNGGTADGPGDPDWGLEDPDPAEKPQPEAPTKFRFHNFYHPFTETMLRQLRKHGVRGLLDPIYNREQDNRDLYRQSVSNEYFEDTYTPSTYVVKEVGAGDDAINVYPKDAFGFDAGDGYSMYNWEVFYHAPMMIATRLMENQKFEEAKVWLEYIFNPNEVDYYDTSQSVAVKNNETPHRYWKLKPFREFCDEPAMDRIIRFVKGGEDELNKTIEVWQNNPFSPYAIGRMRPLSFMKKAVMMYLENLIAWGDYLFARDTMESVNEAALLYINAAKILGKRPQAINRDGNTLSIGQSLSDDMGLSKLIVVEDTLPIEVKLGRKVKVSSALNALNLADFCLPPNDKMFTYWDIVYDRLYKVRNCMNISGLVRKLPLFEAPIDPSILVRAFASGIGVSGALAQIYDKPSPYRFAYLYQKAVEYTGDVKALGNSILSALEKKDGEEMSLLRSGHEINLLTKQLELKKKSIEEAELGIESLEINKQITNERFLFYKNRVKRSKNESQQLVKMQVSLALSRTASTLSGIAGTMALVPEANLGTSGLGPVIEAMFGGRNLGDTLGFAASVLNQMSSRQSSQASIAGIQAGHQRRDEEWGFQEQTALKELENLDKQMESAQLRLAMTEKELELHEVQITQAEEVRVFMDGKFTNKQLYSWMVGKLSKLYFDAYNLAYKMAKKAEAAYYRELGIDQGTDSFINFGHWDNLKRGLLAGESLHNDLKRLDTGYTENNVREYELTKQFSLGLFNAEQLIQLRETGTCDFDISELMYDLDHPGQYYRRIKSVSLTMPCIAGPFTNVSAKLTLLNDKIRVSSPEGDYDDQDDVSIKAGTQGLQSIATSTGQNDSGVFELNFNDSRYLPFEYAGAVSSWRLELPNNENTESPVPKVFEQFDYDTISDVILTVKYMAREGGNTLKDAALKNLETKINTALDYAATNEGLTRVVSMKSEFPSELHQFLNPISGNHETTMAIGSKHLPFVLRNENLNVVDISTVFKLREGYEFGSPTTSVSLKYNDNAFGSAAVIADSSTVFAGLYHAVFTQTTIKPTGDWLINAVESNWDITKDSIAADAKDAIEDIYFVVNYKKV